VGIGHVEHDAVASAQSVDVAEGREVGGAMPGDSSGASDTGKARFGEDPWSLLQFGDAGALDDHEVDADAGDVQAPDGAAIGGVVLELAGEEGDALALSGKR
jgi:hypothetical protein